MSATTSPTPSEPVNPLQQRVRDYFKQPTTLLGLAMLIGAAAGAWTGAFDAGASVTLALAALPLLKLDNTGDAIRQRDLIFGELAALREHNLSLAASLLAQSGADLARRMPAAAE